MFDTRLCCRVLEGDPSPLGTSGRSMRTCAKTAMQGCGGVWSSTRMLWFGEQTVRTPSTTCWSCSMEECIDSTEQALPHRPVLQQPMHYTGTVVYWQQRVCMAVLALVYTQLVQGMYSVQGLLRKQWLVVMSVLCRASNMDPGNKQQQTCSA